MSPRASPVTFRPETLRSPSKRPARNCLSPTNRELVTLCLVTAELISLIFFFLFKFSQQPNSTDGMSFLLD